MRYMDYENFKKEFDRYNDHDWTEDDKRYVVPNLKDGNHWLKIVEGYDKVGPVDNDGNFYDPSHKTTPTQKAIEKVCDDVRDLLISKNRKYGNSALEPRRVFSKSDPIEQIKVRIDDKLSRIATSGTEGTDEDTLQDLIGYLVLLKVAMKQLESLED